MSKSIKLTKQDIEKLKHDFETELKSGKWENGKVYFQATIGKTNRKAKIIFSDIAWRKMQALIQSFDSEVGWHGIARRSDDESKDEYFIDDILVYEQEVTGATVTTDQEKYQMWLADNQLENNNMIRMQGHSHVNMGTTPSGTDWDLYKGILNDLSEKSFYILMIWNKKNQRTIFIYDMLKNTLFENEDIVVEANGEDDFAEFLKNAKSLVKTKSYNYNVYNYNQNKTAQGPAKKITQKPTSNVDYYSEWDDDWNDDYSYCGYGRRSYK